MQDLNKFKNEMNLSGKNVYVGHRYVPKIMGEWDNSQIYEPLSIVQYQGNSFTSRQFVPSGVELTNEEYWASTGNYNAQIEQYRQDVRNLTNTVNDTVDTVEIIDEDLKNVNEKINHMEIVSVKDFGAVGDGVTDDYQAIQNAIDYVFEHGITGGEVYIPSGIYAISQPLNTFNGKSFNNSLSVVSDNYYGVSNGVVSHVILKGNSKDNTIIKSIGNIPIVRPDSQGAIVPMYRLTFKNLRFIGNEENTSFDLTSQTGYPRDIQFYNCDFNHFATGFKYNRYDRESTSGGIHVMLYFESCNFGLNAIGVEVNPDDTDFVKCRFERNTVYGLHVSGGNRIGFDKCKIQYNGGGTLGVETGQIMLSGRLTSLTFDDCYIENKSGTASNNVGSTIFYVKSSPYDDFKTYLYNVAVRDCYINAFHASSLMRVESDVLILRGIQFKGGVVRNIRPTSTNKELMIIPETVQVNTIQFDSYIDGVTNADGSVMSDYIMVKNKNVVKNNSYLNNYIPTLPLAGGSGGSVQIITGSVNNNGSQIYFNGGGFTVTNESAGVFKIKFDKANLSSTGGNPTFMPVIASTHQPSFQAYPVYKNAGEVEIHTRSVINNELGNQPFSFVAFLTVY